MTDFTQGISTQRAFQQAARQDLRAREREALAGVTAPLRFAVAAIRWLDTVIERKRQRNALALLDERLLGDIGLSRYDADHEIAKPFWRLR